MTFEFEPLLYAQNLAVYSALDETVFLPTESKEAVIGKLKEISLKKKAIAEVQNKIIREYIERFETNAEQLDEFAVEKLYIFLESIVDTENDFCKDAPIGLRLSRLLLPYFRKKSNVDRMISVIGMGTICEYMLSYDVDEYDYFAFPKYCEELFDGFEKLSLREQNALLKAYTYRIQAANLAAYKEKFEVFISVRDKILAGIDQMADCDKGVAEFSFFWMTLRFVAMINDAFVQDHTQIKNGDSPIFGFDIEEHREMLEVCLANLKSGYEKYDLPTMKKVALQRSIYLLRYHLGQISFEEYIKLLDELADYDKEGDTGGVYTLVSSAFYMHHLLSLSPYSKEDDERLARIRIEERMPQILEMKKQRSIHFAMAILQFLTVTSHFMSFYDFYDIVLAFTVYADKSLYVHTVMVKEISCLLLEHIIEDNPGFLIGVCGWDKEYIVLHKAEVLALMEKCAMCHDIGKHFLIEIVSNSSRRLTDDEFGIIKTHPQNFNIIYENRLMEETEELKCIRDCALFHHRWHNGEGGYPNMPVTGNMPFADIIAIADSLDAATDSIGRPYSIGKSLDELISEFLEMGGTRYSREVAEILAKPDVRDIVAKIITERREEVNYRIYAFNEIESEKKV